MVGDFGELEFSAEHRISCHNKLSKTRTSCCIAEFLLFLLGLVDLTCHVVCTQELDRLHVCKVNGLKTIYLHAEEAEYLVTPDICRALILETYSHI